MWSPVLSYNMYLMYLSVGREDVVALVVTRGQRGGGNEIVPYFSGGN